MKIVKRDGKLENLSFDKIRYRLRKIVNEKPVLKNIDSDVIAIETIKILKDNIKTSELDEESAKIANIFSSKHPEYKTLSSRIIISNMHKNTTECFSEMAENAYANKNESDEECPLISEEIINIIRENKDTLNHYINYSRDYLYDYFGYKTLEKGYLLKVYLGNKQYKIIERPQHLLMRVALGIHKTNINDVLQTYDLMSEHYFTHATPTLYNAGTNRPQMSSCFLLSIEDSMKGIYKCISDCAEISKNAGGIGIAISDIRSKGSYIKGTNGRSDGIVKMLKVFNETARFANQGSKRNGSFAVYLEPWHADILEFLELRLPSGLEQDRARDLFYALWINDIFMEAVEKDSDWYLMSISRCPGLTETYGAEFNKLYAKYVEEKKYEKVVKARQIWNKILVSQIETGMPYMSYKDSVNKKSNQKNIGIIKSSNLCVAPETLVLTSKGQYKIMDLEDAEIDVWNGYEFSKTIVKKTGINEELLKVKLNNGTEIECTPQHKFYNKNGEIIEAQFLKENTELMNEYTFPVINSNIFVSYTSEEVPINYNLKGKLRWFEKVCDNYIKTNYSNIVIESENKEFIYNTMYLLNTIGVKCIIKRKGTSSYETIEENLKEYSKEILGYDISYVLLISDKETQKLYELGFNPKVFNNKMVPNRLHNLAEYMEINVRGDIISVVSVVNEGRKSDTYCFTEPKRNLGMFNGILTGNCNEITLHTNKNEIAVCNIATFSLPKYLEKDSKGNNVYNFQKLYDVVKIVTKNMNNIIDNNYYPTPETENSNKNNRPISLGIQGTQSLFFEMKIPYESEIAKQINKDIMETIQYAGWEASMEIAKEKGYTYKTYSGSPISEGIFQHNMWGLDESNLKWDWESLRQKIKQYGVVNSMITALPPTASTSQLLCNYESFEPQSSNMYTRSTSSGEFPIINGYLLNDLIKLNLWNDKMKDRIMYYNGSVQNIKEIPDNLKEIYKTRFEISQKTLIDYSRDRGYFVDQSQSLNIFMDQPTAEKLTSMHFYGWKQGLKTGMYYLRSKPAVNAQKFSVDKQLQLEENEKLICSIENKNDCMMCSG